MARATQVHDDDRPLRPPRRRHVALRAQRRRRQLVGVPRRLPRRTVSPRHRADVRVRRRTRPRLDGHGHVRRTGRHDHGPHQLGVPVDPGPRCDGRRRHGRRHEPGLRTPRRAARQAVEGQTRHERLRPSREEGEGHAEDHTVPVVRHPGGGSRELLRLLARGFGGDRRSAPRRHTQRRQRGAGVLPARGPGVHSHQRRATVPVHRGRLVQHQLQGPGRGRPAVVGAHRRRRHREPVRLAPGSVRPELADHPRADG